MFEVLEPDMIDFDHYLQETDPIERVRPVSEYLDEVMHVLSPLADTPKHPKLPFANTWVYFPPGEVTIWAGFNGSGKSMLQGQVLADFAEMGNKVCIASFEMKPAKTIARICRQMFGNRIPNKDQVSSYLSRNNGNLWLYDQQGTVDSRKMIAVIKHCAERLKCQHIAIDSLMKCVRGTDDYNGQKDFVDQLTAAARDYGIHVHLVAHLKKGDSDERRPTRLDISGTAAISDLVDNVLIVWRNKKKERQRDNGDAVNHSDPDALIICDKSRNGEWEGLTKLYFNRESMRFSDMPGRSGIL